ncbi:uncharacterized protein SCHCODRAFT_02637481 [Schizophyllum commune H4-8]|uniref:uncharacterized protein n=1 Tax=Schizophyllum commune (strain H4-8 / FGSC 9210) TaxID=578458 RepID=UPI00215E085A|nr:uncharacterized protein SCHCODRAFT_02637481 [Schizophyllum commune H4-8]KAI5888712.1 hypothetical protein SCHCODRAFT_02637481 [Schizophyllum commune H4-8]
MKPALLSTAYGQRLLPMRAPEIAILVGPTKPIPSWQIESPKSTSRGSFENRHTSASILSTRGLLTHPSVAGIAPLDSRYSHSPRRCFCGESDALRCPQPLQDTKPVSQEHFTNYH